MTREQQLEKALRDLLMETSSYTVAAAMKVLNICTACNRDIEREGECSLCRDGREERGPAYHNFMGDD